MRNEINNFGLNNSPANRELPNTNLLVQYSAKPKATKPDAFVKQETKENKKASKEPFNPKYIIGGLVTAAIATLAIIRHISKAKLPK